jgi:hypothetical protein
MPANGTFVPAANGNFILTTREAFDTKTGKFVPSATGTFLFSTRGDLMTSATMSLPSYLPLGALLNSAGLNAQVAVLPMYPYAANPYAMTNPYTGAASSYPMYPPPYYGSPYSGNYSTTSANDSLKQAYAVAASPTPAPPDPTRTALAASGIPMEDGHIQWPLAFRTLPPDKKRELTDRLEAQLVQVTNGANAVAVDGAKKTVARLSAWLREHQADMADATYRDGARFLRAIDDGLAALKY